MEEAIDRSIDRSNGAGYKINCCLERPFQRGKKPKADALALYHILLCLLCGPVGLGSWGERVTRGVWAVSKKRSNERCKNWLVSALHCSVQKRGGVYKEGCYTFKLNIIFKYNL